MKINIYAIDKKSRNSLYEPLIEHYCRSSRMFADVHVQEIFGKAVAKAQEKTPQESKKSYTEALGKFLGVGYNIALDPGGTEVDSHAFSNLLKDRMCVNFYIAGAFGFESDFLSQCDRTVSLGKITLSHKLVKVVLLEQIFRGLSILHHHPYHK